MSDKRYLGNIITDSPTEPDGNYGSSAAKGVWSLEEQLAYQKAGLWPVPGNFPLDIDAVFSTYLYTGNGSTQTITNGIDLDGEGGMVWLKPRNAGSNHALVDTERGGANSIASDTTAAQRTDGAYGLTFNSNGFDSTGGNLNVNGREQASWTFRKAPKFFDVQTFTGDGIDDRVLSHDLGATPGMVIIKRTSSGTVAQGAWFTYHIGYGFGGGLSLNSSDPAGYTFASPITAASGTTITINNPANNGNVNASGETYVAYLFAHNDGDGDFGPDGDADVIKCGSYTGNGSSGGNSVSLGWEPQFVIIKNTSASADWVMFDAQRGVATGGTAADDKYLFPNGSNSEGGGIPIDFTSTGFEVFDTSTRTNSSGNNFIYIAIRRGPLAVPEDATKVFAVDALQSPSTTPAFQSGFPVDLAIVRNVSTTYNWYVKDRLRGTPNLQTNLTSAEVSWFSNADFDYMDGWYDTGANTSFYSWMWKRAPGYFDMVAYTGNSTAGRTVSHNLTVAPEMMWIKRRSAAENWAVYHSALGNNKVILLQSTGAAYTDSAFNNTTPTDSVFSVSNATETNASGSTYIAYLFASCPGVSKVGSYTGTASALNIDCGFTSGARFVLIKRTDVGGQWFIFDSERGIVSGNDPFLRPNSDGNEETAYDIIDPFSSGFSLTSNNDWETNISGGSYIFYAIA